ncbi:MAG: MFS transporter [Hungatella sp.]|jgi:predicted MFS family arabinose efflux permease|nr:MFS transporter [Hungatella sp.]
MGKEKKSGKVITLILMMLSLNTIYVLPYLMYTYYAPLQEAMGLLGRDADYGKLLNVYGIANIILYIPGGMIADKFDAKKLLIFSMIGTGALGLWEATWPSYTILMIIHVAWAFTTVLTYWSASIKCINVIAGADEQGSMYGSLEAGRGIVGIILTTIFVGIFTKYSADSSKAMSYVVITCSVVMILVGIAMVFLMPVTNVEGATNKGLLDSVKAMGQALSRPVTYLLSGMIFGACIAQAGISYLAPYLANVCGMDQNMTVIFANYNRTICTLIGASIAAYAAKKMGRSSKFMIYAGLGSIVSYVLLVLIPGSAAMMFPILVIMVFSTLCYPVFRALYYAVVDELGTQKNVVGSVIGIASILGFLPDTFYTSMCGARLEADPVGGYKFVFITCMAAMALGLICAFISDRKILKYRETDEYRASIKQADM